jgi:hypothetical protein
MSGVYSGRCELSVSARRVLWLTNVENVRNATMRAHPIDPLGVAKDIALGTCVPGVRRCGLYDRICNGGRRRATASSGTQDRFWPG